MTTPSEYGFTSGSTRPSNQAYGDQSQVGGSVGDFNTGRTGETNADGVASVFSLNRDADRFNSAVPRQFSQHSVLQTSMPSSNGMSQQDYEQRVLPGGFTLPSANGSSQSSYQKSLLMRLHGIE